MIIVPEKARTMVQEHILSLDTQMPGLLEAYYLVGSISLGAFDERQSDIDFVAVVSHAITSDELALLIGIHNDIRWRFPRTDLMGMYLSSNELHQPSGVEACPVFIEGRFQGFRRYDPNAIDSFQLKQYGIPIKGNASVSVIQVDLDILLSNTVANLNTYWKNWRNACAKPTDPRFFGLFFSLRQVEWGVLGVSRLLYTLRERDIASKTGAGEYALTSVPERWHRILREALRLRGGGEPEYRSIFQRRRDALGYIAYIIEQGNLHGKKR